MSESAPEHFDDDEKPRAPDYHGMTEDDGFEAFIMGKQRRDNPFAQESPLYEAWLNGWIQARKIYGR